MNDKEILENFKEDYNYLENYNEIDVQKIEIVILIRGEISKI